MATNPPPQNVVMIQQPAVVQNVNPGQVQTVVVGQQSNSTTTANHHPRHKHKKALRGLGITECIIGGLSIVLAVFADSIVSREAHAYRSQYYRAHHYSSYSNHLYDSTYESMNFTFVSQGIWSGIFIIITGILGIRVMNTPSKCMYVANMTLAIITSCIAFSACVVSGLAAEFSIYSESMVAYHSIITVLISVAVIITITHSALCCSGVCYSSKSVSTQQVVYYPQQNMTQPQPQYVQGPNGQLMMVVSQPITPQIIPQVPQTPVFQQVPITVSPVATQMPSASVQQPVAAYQNLPEKEGLTCNP